MSIDELYILMISKISNKTIRVNCGDLCENAQLALADAVVQNYWTQPKTRKTKFLGKLVGNEFVFTKLSSNRSDLGYTVSGNFNENGVDLTMVPGTAFSMLLYVLSALVAFGLFYGKFIGLDLIKVLFLFSIFVFSFGAGVFKYVKYAEAEVYSVLTANGKK